MVTQFEKLEITVPYNEEARTFSVWRRPLWNWALDLLRDRSLAPHFVWDAERLFKFNGESWVRFIHEPWTADAWWKVQVSDEL